MIHMLCSVTFGLPALNFSRIKELNTDKNMTWVAGENEFMRGKTEEDIRRLCGTVLLDSETDNVDVMYHTEGEDLPEAFDVRDEWSEYIHPIRNQERCGSCWAFSAAEVLTDRFSIMTQGKVNTILSPEDLVSCDKTDMGCMGGQLPSAWRYMRDNGIVSDSCFPYNSGNGTTSACVNACVDSEIFETSKHKARNFYKLSTIEDIQREIMKNGPVQAAFRVYKSFMAYTSGVYQRSWWKVWDSIMGGHAIKIVGWGTQKNELGQNVDYWTIANSWDTTWGEKGYFKMKRGVNMCGIESNVYAGLPKIK